MKTQVELQRISTSRVSWDPIRIVAGVMQGVRAGKHLLPDRLTDIEHAKSEVARRLAAAFRVPLDIEWIDRTNEGREG